MKKFLVFLFVLMLLGASADLYAWPDGNREGLLLGVTAGFGNVEMSSGSTSDSGMGWMAGCYIGNGFNEQLLVSFRYRYTNVTINDMGFSCFAWTGDVIYFPVRNQNWFLNAGFGPALVAPEFGESKSGWTFYGGIGYEITKYLFISVDFAHATLADGLSGNQILFAVSAIGY